MPGPLRHTKAFRPMLEISCNILFHRKGDYSTAKQHGPFLLSSICTAGIEYCIPRIPEAQTVHIWKNMSLPAWIFLLCWFWFQQPRAALSQSLFNILTCMDWRVDFLPCKAKIRRHPDGWQGFLTQSGRKIRRQDMRGGDIKQALSVYQIKGFPGDDSWMAISDQILREFAGVLLLSFCNGICGIRLLQKDITCIPLVLQNTSNHTD